MTIHINVFVVVYFIVISPEGLVLSIVVDVIGVLISGLTERQIQIIYFAVTAMEQAHKKKPNFLNKKGITHKEIQELKATLEDSGNDGVLPLPPNAYIV